MTTCVLCLDEIGDDAERVSDTAGRAWHKGCAALALAHRAISWRGGPQLDPEAEAAYRDEQADYE